jgi:hypothetical protein
MKKCIRLMALAFGPPALFMPTLATAQDVTVNVVSPATVFAKGAAVDASVHVACTSPPFASGAQANSANITLSLTERVGSGVTTGGSSPFGTNLITCDGSLQTFEVILTPFNGRRYAQGTAVAQVIALVVNPLCCAAESAQQIATIQLVK